MAYRYRRRNPETGEMELYEDAGRSIPVNFGGMNLTGTPNLDYLQNLVNLAQQPQLGPDEFGSYSIPYSDPTYRSGFDYARSIAGGIPMSQVIAPGVSYSPEQPMGYTQEQLNIPRDVEKLTPPPILPPTREPDDPRYFGTGIGGVTIFDDKDPKAIEHRDIITGKIIGESPKDNLQDIGKLFDLDLLPDFSQFVTKEDMPTFIPEVPTGSDFSVDRDVLDRPMISGLENRDLMDVDKLIPPKINDQIFIDDRPIIDERMIDRGYGPGIMPPLPPIDIDKLIPPVDLPPINIMDLPPVDLPPINIPPRIPLDLPIVRPPTIMDKPRIMDRQTIMDELTGGRFSIDQQRPMGLF
tara:strand:+ start:134 stop:1192 length:1059 start_codon:yes stop_codon:yes gene_type:complete